MSIVAQAVVARVGVYPTRTRGSPSRPHRGTQPSAAPLVFLVQDSNRAGFAFSCRCARTGLRGWIHASDVRLSQHDYRIVVAIGAHTITVYRGTTVIDKEPVGVGRKDTPTPGGTYYTKELLRPPTPTARTARMPMGCPGTPPC